MKPSKEPSGNYVANHECEWCQGTGMISVPEYKTIWQLGLYHRIMEIGWTFAPQISTYCHLCFQEPPKSIKKKMFNNLLDTVLATKAQGNEELFLLRHCLLWHLTLRMPKQKAEQMLSNICLEEIE